MEKLVNAAKRELEEETGIKAKKLKYKYYQFQKKLKFLKLINNG